jgi:hypothetical protein
LSLSCNTNAKLKKEGCASNSASQGNKDSYYLNSSKKQKFKKLFLTYLKVEFKFKNLSILLFMLILEKIKEKFFQFSFKK